MTDTLWPLIITGGFTLAAGLGGVALGQWFGLRADAARRREDRRAYQARLLAELLEAGFSWVSVRQALIPLFGKMKDDDLLEFMETDSGRAMVENDKVLNKAIVRASLEVGHPTIAPLIHLIRKRLEMYPEHAMGPAMKQGMDGVLKALEYVRELRHDFERLELEAASVTQVALT